MNALTPTCYSGYPVRVTVKPAVGPARVKIITPAGTGLMSLNALKIRAEEITLSWTDIETAKSTAYFDAITRQWTPFDATE